MSFMFPKDVELPPEPKGWTTWQDPDPRTVDESEPDDDYSRGFLEGMRVARLGRRSTSKAWLLLALGVGAALGFVAGWVAR